MPQRHPNIEVIGFDAIGTIFGPRLPRNAMMAKVFTDVTGVRVEPETFAAFMTQLRRRHTRPPTMPARDYWRRLNAEALDSFAPGRFTGRARTQTAAAIHRRHLRDADLYEVSAAMRELLEWLVTECEVPIAIMSNQSQQSLDRHLRCAGIRELFNGYLFPTTDFGDTKASPMYWQHVCGELEVVEARAIAYVGNSPQSDLWHGQTHGAPTALIDREHRLNGLTISGVAIVHSEQELRTWMEDILPKDMAASRAARGRRLATAL